VFDGSSVSTKICYAVIIIFPIKSNQIVLFLIKKLPLFSSTIRGSLYILVLLVFLLLLHSIENFMIFFDRVLLIFLGGSEFHDTNFIVTSHSDGHAFDEFSIFQYQQISLLVSLAIFGDMFA